MDLNYFMFGMFIGFVVLLATIIRGVRRHYYWPEEKYSDMSVFIKDIGLVKVLTSWQLKCSLVLFFIVAYIGAGIDYGRRGIEDLRAIHVMFIVGWPVFLIAILMLFPNKNKEDN